MSSKKNDEQEAPASDDGLSRRRPGQTAQVVPDRSIEEAAQQPQPPADPLARRKPKPTRQASRPAQQPQTPHETQQSAEQRYYYYYYTDPYGGRYDTYGQQQNYQRPPFWPY